MPVAPSSPLPVLLLTGFLGSGKTTLLSRLVRDPSFADTAVIVNEFGAVGLDHVLLEKSDDRDVVLLDSGCLCCASNSPLQDSLEALWYRRLRGEVPPFARVVVETSGLADPLPLINALHGDPSVARHYRFAGVVTVLDVLNGLDNLRRFRESAVQLAVADRVLLSKLDLTSDEQAQAVRAAVNAARPGVPVGIAAEIDGARLLDEPAGGAIAASPAWGATVSAAASTSAPGGLGHLAAYGITSHTLRLAAALTWPRYAELVRLLQQRLGERLLRMKGILDMEGEGLVAVHGVRHVFATPVAITAPVPSAQRGVMVLITCDAGGDDVEAIAEAAGAVVAHGLATQAIRRRP